MPAPEFDDEWRRWIAENVMLGGTVESILPTLLRQGFEAGATRREVEAAIASPYTSGARRLLNRLRKREWVLEIHRKLGRILPGGDLVERRHRPPRDAFLRDFYAANRPVVITGAMDDWPALGKWAPAYLRGRFGNRTVEVQASRGANPRYEVDSQRHRRQMPFSEFIDLVVGGGPTNDHYMTANNNSRNFESLSELWDDIVQIPEYLDGSAKARGFLWFGPAGTITPLHHDLTNNFMAQVYGRKLVKLVPACDIGYVANEFHCYTNVDAEKVDWRRFPQYRQARVIDVVIGPGELLFLPVGWWHYVRALDVSITVSFTNFVVDNDFHTAYTTYHDV
ncbi:MAG TPA: cupin-like domain-containing protein [Pirellulales bacterium]|nr:cupin-like domain-containing protein [Pirellulales bacterium]